jgi:hypothetical protein
LRVSAGNDLRIERFDPSMQDAFRALVLDGMAERWGAVDESLNTDLDDIDNQYENDCVLVAVDGVTVVGTGILLIRATEGEIVRMSVYGTTDDGALENKCWRSWSSLPSVTESSASS